MACCWCLLLSQPVVSGAQRNTVQRNVVSRAHNLVKGTQRIIVQGHSNMVCGTCMNIFNKMQRKVVCGTHNNNSNNKHHRIQRRYSRFFTISSQRCELSPTRTLKWPGRNRVQITCNTLSAYHVQVSCCAPLGTKGQLSY